MIVTAIVVGVLGLGLVLWGSFSGRTPTYTEQRKEFDGGYEDEEFQWDEDEEEAEGEVLVPGEVPMGNDRPDGGTNS